MRLRFKPTHVVLAMLCVMYFITYVDRVNISTAASEIQKELGLSNTQLGLVFSAFAYPYLLFQVIGGWVGDRFGPRKTLFWCGMIWAAATIMTGFVSSLLTLFMARVALGFGEGATFPTATRAMQILDTRQQKRFCARAHACIRAAGKCRHAAFDSRLDGVADLARLVRRAGIGQPGVGRDLGALFPQRAQAIILISPRPNWRRCRRALSIPGLRCHGDRCCGGCGRSRSPISATAWSLWLYLNWLPLFFKNNYNLDIRNSALFASGVFFAGVIGDSLGGILSDRILKKTGDVRLARLSVTVAGFAGALLSLVPILFIHDITVVALCMSAGFFFAELVIGPMWSVPMDIAPKYSGTAAGLMNTGSALAAIVSPLVAGYVIDATGNWYLPFLMSMGLLLLGGFCAFLMHPEMPFEASDSLQAAGRPVAAG